MTAVELEVKKLQGEIRDLAQRVSLDLTDGQHIEPSVRGWIRCDDDGTRVVICSLSPFARDATVLNVVVEPGRSFTPDAATRHLWVYCIAGEWKELGSGKSHRTGDAVYFRPGTWCGLHTDDGCCLTVVFRPTLPAADDMNIERGDLSNKCASVEVAI